MTVAEALRDAHQELARTSDTARLDAELLMAHALGVSRSNMLLRLTSAPAPKDFALLIERRARHEPVAYIIGSAHFFGREFAVGPGALVPRSDSETVVAVMLEGLAASGQSAPRILDLGTGSGALLLTIVAECEGATGMGVDCSSRALEYARSNAAALNLAGRVEFTQRDWSAADWRSGLGQFDAIICNPPYVESGAELAPDVRDYEPADALFGGEQGLDDYALIIPQISELIQRNGFSVFEIGPSQPAAVIALARDAGFAARMHRDLAGRPRAIHIW